MISVTELMIYRIIIISFNFNSDLNLIVEVFLVLVKVCRVNLNIPNNFFSFEIFLSFVTGIIKLM